ncbi:MAG TPA: TonB-dependent receptor [Rhizomicrobium sp.]
MSSRQPQHFKRLKQALLATSMLAVGAPIAAHAQAIAAAAPENVEQVVVTGTRLSGGFTTPTPVTAVGTAEMENRAPTTISDIVNELPQLRQTTGTTQAPRGNSNGQNLVDLRGLGTNRTLVLIDGNRIVPTNIGGSVDINLIPTILVNRVDVVTGGASAAYGSDAVAGVINFVMKDHIDGVIGSMQYGESERGDNIEPAFSLAAGHAFLDGRLNLVGGGDFSDNHGVGTIYSRPDLYGKQQACLVSNTAAQRAAGNLPVSSLVTGCTWSTQAAGSLIVGAKTTGGASYTGLNNIAFGPNGVPYNFQQGTVASILMYGGPDNPNDPHGNPNGNLLLKAPSKRWTAYGKATFDIDDDTSVFAQYLYGHNEATGLSTFHQETNVVVLATNPFIPTAIAQQMAAHNLASITIGKQEEALGGYQFLQKDTTSRIALGAKGKVFGDWSWDVNYIHGESPQSTPLVSNVLEGNYLQAIYAVPGPNGVPVCGPVATNPNLAPGSIGAGRASQVSPGCVPFNIFGPTINITQGNGKSFATAGIGQSLLAGGVGSLESANYFGHTTQSGFYYQQDVVSANLRGSPFETWAGPASIAVGIEHRREGGSSFTDFEGANNYSLSNNGSNYRGSFEVTEGYVEAGIPLAKDLSWAQSLDLNAAVRETGYSLFGNLTTFKFGVNYQPTEDLRFRATRSRDVREPSITDLNATPTLGITASFNNPVTGSSGPEYTLGGGNAALKPESADSTTIGMIYSPTGGWFSGLHASVDWFDVNIHNVITTVSNVNIASYCAQGIQTYCSAMVNGGGPGGALLIKSIPQNLNQQKTNGMDFELGYNAPLEDWGLPGTFNIRWLTTWTDVLSTTSAVTYTDFAGSGVNGGVANWVSNLNLTYSLGRSVTNLQLRYTSDIRGDATLIGPGQNGYSPSLPNSININQFPAQTYMDISQSYDIINNEEGQLTAYATVTNVLDKDPPGGGIAFVAFITGGNPYDLIGRTYKAGVRFRF